MAKRQTGKIKVKCNVCKKEQEVATIDYYKPGGLRGGCCKVERIENFVTLDGAKTKKTVSLGNTWSTVKVK